MREENVPTTGRQAIEAHNQIREAIHTTRIALAELDVASPHPHDFARVRHLLHELQDHLISHFRAEEVASLHDRLGDVMTSADQELTRLREEHNTILETLERSEGTCRTCSPLSAVRLHQDVGTLLVSLERHEQEENELMEQAFGDERA